MVCQRSRVIAVNVKTDSSLANTCNWHTEHTYFLSNMNIYECCYLCRAITRARRTARVLTHREEARGTAAQAHLPVYGVVVVPATGEHVHSCYDYQVDAHAEVRKGQVAHEETRNCQLGAAA